jgi:hypothetical protein
LILLTALAAASCTGPVSDAANAGASGAPSAELRGALDEEVPVSDTTIIAAQEALTPTVMALPGVVGTAVGLCDGSPCIQVLVAAPDSVLLAQLPERFQGYQVDVRVVGDIRAQDTTDASRER